MRHAVGNDHLENCERQQNGDLKRNLLATLRRKQEHEKHEHGEENARTDERKDEIFRLAGDVENKAGRRVVELFAIYRCCVDKRPHAIWLIQGRVHFRPQVEVQLINLVHPTRTGNKIKMSTFGVPHYNWLKKNRAISVYRFSQRALGSSAISPPSLPFLLFPSFFFHFHLFSSFPTLLVSSS